jgi:predicted nucleotidyltransferase
VDRDAVRDRVLSWARQSAAVTAAAVVGSEVRGSLDAWSDVDLTFAVAGDVSATLGEFTARMEAELDAVQLFDLPVRTTIYRVFMLPGPLQVDLSFTPAADFAPGGPDWRLLFGAQAERPLPPPPNPRQMLGLGVHHLRYTRACVERGRLWQALYVVNELRDEAMSMAAVRCGLRANFGRGYDALPAGVLDMAADAVVRSVTREEILRARRAAAVLLEREASLLPGGVAAALQERMREVMP